MSTQETWPAVTEQDILSLGSKLDVFASGLPAAERFALARVLERAGDSATAVDVQSYAFPYFSAASVSSLFWSGASMAGFGASIHGPGPGPGGTGG